MHMATTPALWGVPPAIFIGDNGRCTCWKHSGNSIQTTGRDISGQEAVGLTAEEAQALNVRCEDCKNEH